MSSPSAGKRRMDTDVIKLIESKHEVTILGSNLNEFCVKFYGPRGTSYEGELIFYSFWFLVFINGYYRRCLESKSPLT